MKEAKASSAGRTPRDGRRSAGGGALALLCALLVLVLDAFPVYAALTNPYDSVASSAFPSLPNNPQAAAIDTTTHDVYIVNIATGSVQRFAQNGSADNFTAGPAAGTNTLGGFHFDSPHAAQVAIDNTGGPTQSDIYVADSNSGAIRVFAPTGNPLGSFVSHDGGEICGVALDKSGAVYLGLYGGAAAVDVFTPTANPAAPSFAAKAAGPNTCNVAVDSSGTIYADNWDGGTIERYTPSSFPATNTTTYTDQGALSGANGVTGLSVDPTNDHLYVAQSTQVSGFDSFAHANNLLDVFGAGIVGHSEGLAANGSVYVTDQGNSSLDVFGPLATIPDLTTGAASNIAGTSATVAGHVDPAGGGSVTDCHFEYVDDATFQGSAYSKASSAPCSPVTPYSNPTDVTANLTNLQTGTTYHYRILATDAGGTSPGTGQTFTTLFPPIIDTTFSSDLSSSGATLHAQINPKGFATTYHFEYGNDTSYGSSTPESASIGSDNTDHPASASVTGLSPGTTYHFRVVAKSSVGTSSGADETFTSIPLLPTVDATSASGVSSIGASLGAQIKPGFGATIYLFEYGTDASYGSNTVASDPIGSDNTDHPASASVTGLAPGTTYHFRVVAINLAGTTYGPDQTFVTANVPDVVSTSSSNVTQTSATLGALIRPALSSTTYHFEYGTDMSYGLSTLQSASIGSDNGSHAASANITGLTPDTTYHFRVVATNTVGVTDGPDQTFTTATPPPPSTVPPSTTKCKTGFVKRQGKCVRKQHHKKHHKRSARHG